MINSPSMNKITKTESPKTPGGISKSLLTPCRRLGLSRNWKKGGPSPFRSPLASNTNLSPVVNEEETRETRKRKKSEEVEQVSKSSINIEESIQSSNSPKLYDNLTETPTRNTLISRKKSKAFSLTQWNEEQSIGISDKIDNLKCKKNIKDSLSNSEIAATVSVPIKVKSKSKKSPVKVNNLVPESCSEPNKNSDKSPNNLTKECIVVIQKNLLKNTEVVENKDTRSALKSQTIFDSDSDDVPLCNISKKENSLTQTKPDKNCEIKPDNRIDTDIKNVKVTKLQDKTTSTGELKVKPKNLKNRELLKNKQNKHHEDHKPSSQSSNSCDDDFEFNKRTILIKKSYDKVVKPTKVKSTGSITQKDIDDIKARIDMKRKLLIAKGMSKETEELMGLIKKWQKGCQDALMELLVLMKIKCPDRHNMDYSEILQMLKIPPSLVGYDSDNDCFNTPDDPGVILSSYDLC